jgi:hypothetical protein
MTCGAVRRITGEISELRYNNISVLQRDVVRTFVQAFVHFSYAGDFR